MPAGMSEEAKQLLRDRCGDGPVDRQTLAMVLGFDEACESRDEPISEALLNVILGEAGPPRGYRVVVSHLRLAGRKPRMPRLERVGN